MYFLCLDSFAQQFVYEDKAVDLRVREVEKEGLALGCKGW